MTYPLRAVSTFALTAAIGLTAMSLPLSVAHAQDGHQMDNKSMQSGAMDHSKMSGMHHMDGMSMTGNADYDFAVNMKKHHQMALEMAEAEIKNGNNAAMVKMARGIISSQTKEIAAFDRWLAKQPKPMQNGMSMPK